MPRCPQQFDLEDRSILITGANRGLGAALCKSILQYSPKIIHAGYRSTPGNFEDPRIRWCQLDIQDAASVANAAASVDELDVLINNAGVESWEGSIVDLDLDWRACSECTRAGFHTCYQWYRQRRRSGKANTRGYSCKQATPAAVYFVSHDNLCIDQQMNREQQLGAP